VLRDYARLGRLLAYDGAWEGRQLIPRQWLLDATTVRPGDAHLAPGTATPYFGYGYQTWLFPANRRFALLGIRGQIISSIRPQNSSWCTPPCAEKPSDPGSNAETVTLFLHVVAQLGK